MEHDCLKAHGAAANLHERLFTLSDSSQMHICGKCKNMANVIQRSVQGSWLVYILGLLIQHPLGKHHLKQQLPAD
ncbi:hypothetical protein K7X08_025900 [Anisodus acutangulus]|uniref:DNA-directed RNA polymerase n=1 Tax=Anisodus acutangulus TaxID=402998 RepID=A0A9Q1N228_9SOLA|nr:hypothetical protein K7X08_025900 [Anisodus acutangulus]